MLNGISLIIILIVLGAVVYLWNKQYTHMMERIQGRPLDDLNTANENLKNFMEQFSSHEFMKELAASLAAQLKANEQDKTTNSKLNEAIANSQKAISTQLSGLLEKIKELLNNKQQITPPIAGKDLDQLAARIAAELVNVSAITEKIGGLEAKLRELSSRVLTSENGLRTLDGSASSLKQLMNDLKAAIQPVLDDVKKAEEGAQNERDAAQQKMNETAALMDAAKADMGQAAQTVADALQAVHNVQTQTQASVQAIDEKLSAFGKISEELNRQAEGCRTREAQLTCEANGFNERLNDFKGQLQALGGVVAGLTALSGALPASVEAASLKQKLEDAEQKLSECQAEVERMTTENAEVKAQKEQETALKGAEKDRADKLQTSLEESQTANQKLQDEKTQLNSTLDSTKADLERTRKENERLSTEVTNLNRTCEADKTTISNQETAIRQKDATILQLEGEAVANRNTIAQKNTTIGNLERQLGAMYPAVLLNEPAYRQRYNELCSMADGQGIVEAKVCLHLLTVVNAMMEEDKVKQDLPATLKEQLLSMVWNFSLCFTTARSKMEPSQSDQTIKALADWQNFFSAIGKGVFSLNLPQKGDFIDMNWMSAGRSTAQSVGTVDSWAVFEGENARPKLKAYVR